MKLDEYIEKSLIAIAKGVTEAQKKAEVTIAPSAIEGKPNFTPQLVKFEVEVSTSLEGGGSINVMAVGELGAKKSGQNSHKLTFEVPVHFNSENIWKHGAKSSKKSHSPTKGHTK